MDLADKASAEQALHLDKAIESARGVVPVPGEGQADCKQCAEPVEPGRRALGYSICLHCASRNESMPNRHW